MASIQASSPGPHPDCIKSPRTVAIAPKRAPISTSRPLMARKRISSSLARCVPCVNLCLVESISIAPSYDPRDRGKLGKQLSQGLAMMRCLEEMKEGVAEKTSVERWGHYTYWLCQKELERPKAGTYRASRDALRTRVTNRLLYEGEHADKPEHRILALSKLLADCTSRDNVDKELPLDVATEDAVRVELRNPQPRLIELMIDEWCGGSSGSTEISLDEHGNPPRPPIAELVRRLLPHWEDVLRAEGWERTGEP